MGFLKECWDRVKSPTPKFWRKVRNFCGFCAAFSAAAIAIPGELLPSHKWVEELIKYSMLFGAFGAGLAQLTREPNDQNNPPANPAN